MSMNYQPVFVGNQTNGNAGIKANIDVGQAKKMVVHGLQYLLLPLLASDSQGPKSSEDEVVDDAGKKTNDEPVTKDEKNAQKKKEELQIKKKEGYDNNTNRLNTVSSSVSAAGQSFDNDDLPTDPFMPNLEDTTCIFGSAYDHE
ncbi:hypothetical protein Tco_1309065 [Tanacetum coccineum]